MNTNLRSEQNRYTPQPIEQEEWNIFLISGKPLDLFLQSHLFSLSNDSDRLLVHTNSLPTSPQILDPFP